MYSYQGKPFNGIIEFYNDDNTLIGEEEFVDGHVGGLQNEYYDNGNPKEEYTLEFGLIEGMHKEWDEEGNIIGETMFKDGWLVNQ